jgi:SagB-type dehydrogenase family enzyme
MSTDARDRTPLPTPRTDGPLALETAIARRRTVREFDSGALSGAELGQLLWAAQGVTGADGRRAVPSAGATFPLELYVVTAEGLWHYEPAGHALSRLGSRDLRGDLQCAAHDQVIVGVAPLTIVITGAVSRTAVKYGPERAVRYADMEAGHAAQDILLQAVALDLVAVPIGSFADTGVSSVLGLPAEEAPLYMVAVGRPAS